MEIKVTDFDKIFEKDRLQFIEIGNAKGKNGLKIQ